MGVFDIVGKVMGAAAGTVKAAAEIGPNAVSTIATHVSAGVASPPMLPNIGAVLSSAATTPHASGSGQTVLEHYVAHYGGAALAAIAAAIVPHIPGIPAGLKTAGSAALVGFALKMLHDQAAHLEAPYAGAPA
jgi:hypothetical protein